MRAFASLGKKKALGRVSLGILVSVALSIGSGCLAQAQDSKSAKEAEIAKFSERIKADQKDAAAFIHRGTFYFQLSDYKNAVADFDHYIQLTNKADGYYMRAVAKISLLDNDGAIADFTEAIKLSPEYDVAHLARAQLITSSKDKRTALAIEDCNACIRLNFRPSRAYLALSTLKMDEGNDQEAITNATEAIKIEPKLGDAYENRAIAKIHLGDITGAQEDAKSYAQLVPDDHEVHMKLGDTMRKYKHYKEACEEYKEIVKVKPQLVDAWTAMGECYSNIGQFDEAEKCYRQAVTVDDKSYLGVYNVGDMLRKQGKFDEAKEWFVRAKKIPTPAGAEKLEQVLEDLIKRNNLKDKS